MDIKINTQDQSLRSFLIENDLCENQNIAILVDSNLRSDNLKFRDFHQPSGLLFFSLSADTDCIAIPAGRINFIKVNEQVYWKRINFHQHIK